MISSRRQALLDSTLLPPLSELLDDTSSICRRNVHKVLNRLAMLPAGRTRHYCPLEALFSAPVFSVMT